MKIQKLNHNFSVCQITDTNTVDFTKEFCFVCKTDDELSLVCITDYTPSNTIQRSDGWKGFKIKGTLDFALIGILANISSLLAENEISIFAVSTYNTDYVLTKAESYDKALKVLENAGYEIE